MYIHIYVLNIYIYTYAFHVLQKGFFTPGQIMHRIMLGKGFFTFEIRDFLGSLLGEKARAKNPFSTIAQTV